MPSSSGIACRDRAAEDEQQQDREDRERDQLRAREVLAGLVVDLVEAHAEAAEADVERARADPAQRLLGRLAAVALDVLRRQGGRDDERAAVGFDQHARRLAVGERVDDVADVARVRQRATDAVDLPDDGKAPDVQLAPPGSAHEHDDPRARVVAELRAQGLRRPLALRGRVGEAGGLEVVLDVVAESTCAEHEHTDEREDELRLAPRQGRDAIEHGETLQTRRPFSRFRARRTAADRPDRLGRRGSRRRS